MTNYQAIMGAVVAGHPWSRIVRDYGCSRSTIDRAKRVLAAHHFTAEEVAALTEAELHALFPDKRRRNEADYVAPDFASMLHRRRRRDRGTLKEEHERYLASPGAEGQRHYSYKQFSKLFYSYAAKAGMSAEIKHLPGEEMLVDWAAGSLALRQPFTGATWKAYLFMAALPHSGLIYSQALPDRGMRGWLAGHQGAMEFFSGVPRRVLPEDVAVAASHVVLGARARETYRPYYDFAAHFGFSITLARSMKVRPPAEDRLAVVASEVAEVAIGREFENLEELNTAVRKRVTAINDAPGFRGRDTTRRQLFESAEAVELNPLPRTRWRWTLRTEATVGLDYFVEVDGHHYSVPWQLVGSTVEVQILGDEVVIYSGETPIARHRVGPPNGGYTTADEHFPSHH